MKCPACKHPLNIPTAKTTATTQHETPVEAAGHSALSGAEELFDELGIGTLPGGPGRRCPECKAEMANEAIICIQCGYNERIGRKMVTQRPVTQQDRNKKASK